MKIGQWYKLSFRDGDTAYFTPKRQLKNGGMAGIQYEVNQQLYEYRDRLRAMTDSLRNLRSDDVKKMPLGGARRTIVTLARLTELLKERIAPCGHEECVSLASMAKDCAKANGKVLR